MVKPAFGTLKSFRSLKLVTKCFSFAMNIGLSGNPVISGRNPSRTVSFPIYNWSSSYRIANNVPSVCRMVNIIIDITPSCLHSLLFGELPCFLFKPF